MIDRSYSPADTGPARLLPSYTAPSPVGEEPRGPSSFGELLANLVQQVDARQQEADRMVEALALGEPVELHHVMLALNEAQNAFNLTLQVRNKILDVYQELMRTSY
ncbi:MAG: flagellar hook-basal body complex protein FliE [Armatimonadetes bacterium]|nr:flagellar hook-basal body complex protein FliE [Armatimonadota bacterium]